MFAASKFSRNRVGLTDLDIAEIPRCMSHASTTWAGDHNPPLMRSTQSMLVVAKEDGALLDSLLVSDCNRRAVVAIFYSKSCLHQCVL